MCHAELSTTDSSGNARVYKKGYPCGICKTIFATADILNRHMQSQSCRSKNRQVASGYDHISLRKNQIIAACGFCNKIFKSQLRFDAHYRTHFGFVCGIDKCSHFFKTSLTLYKHRERSHKSYINSSSSPADMQSLQFQCYICKVYQPNRRLLESHLKRHKIPIERKRRKGKPCDICGKLFLLAANLAKHKISHDDISNVPNVTEIMSTDQRSDSRFQCDICEKQFARKQAVIEHISKKHDERNNVAKELHQCDICKQTLASKMNVIRHMANFHGINPIKKSHFCDICGNGYVSQESLNQHKYRHKNSEPKCICTVCGKAFRSLSEFTDHLNGHKGLKPYKCTDCGKSFARSTKLKTHMRIHTGVKPYICSEKGCDRAYAHSIDLKRHLWGQHKIYTKKHPCQICGKVFPENKILVKHLINHP